jgi:hypothetical protein
MEPEGKLAIRAGRCPENLYLAKLLRLEPMLADPGYYLRGMIKMRSVHHRVTLPPLSITNVENRFVYRDIQGNISCLVAG